MPATHARQSVHALHSWARSRPDPGEFQTALRQLADELDSAPHLINYQRRREALSYWCIDPATWQQLLNRLGDTHVGQMGLGDHKRQAASIFVWARVTQGEHLLAPAPILDQLPPEVQKAWRDTLGHSCRAFLAGRGTAARSPWPAGPARSRAARPGGTSRRSPRPPAGRRGGPAPTSPSSRPGCWPAPPAQSAPGPRPPGGDGSTSCTPRGSRGTHVPARLARASLQSAKYQDSRQSQAK